MTSRTRDRARTILILGGLFVLLGLVQLVWGLAETVGAWGTLTGGLLAVGVGLILKRQDN